VRPFTERGLEDNVTSEKGRVCVCVCQKWAGLSQNFERERRLVLVGPFGWRRPRSHEGTWMYDTVSEGVPAKPRPLLWASGTVICSGCLLGMRHGFF
jgi:hypothetical protein